MLHLWGQVPVFISPRHRVAQLCSQARGSLFVASYDSQGYSEEYSNPPPHRINFQWYLWGLHWSYLRNGIRAPELNRVEAG
jgi:hypothetical protein